MYQLGVLGAFLGFCMALAFLMAKMGILVGGAFIGLPFVAVFLIWVFQSPSVAIFTMMYLAFFATGITRYVPAPLGLGIDGLLTLGWLSLLFQRFKYTDWTPLKHDFNLATLLWFIWLIIEIFNPLALSKTAWFYAMRGIGFYQVVFCGHQYIVNYLLVFTVHHIGAGQGT